MAYFLVIVHIPKSLPYYSHIAMEMMIDIIYGSYSVCASNYSEFTKSHPPDMSCFNVVVLFHIATPVY